MEETWGLSSLTCHDLHTIAVPEIMGKLSKSNRWLALALPPPQYPPNLLRSHHHSPGPEDHPRDASQEITAISRHEQADPRAALEKGEEAGAGTLYARGKSAHPGGSDPISNPTKVQCLTMSSVSMCPDCPISGAT
jgi:hypothetical protein